MFSLRRYALAFALVGVACGARGSFSVTSAPGGGFYSGQADAMLDTSNFDVRIMASGGAQGRVIGSAVLFAMNSGSIGAQNAVTLGFATADALMTGVPSWTIGIPDGNSFVSLSNAAFTEVYTARGNNEDLGFVGATIYQSQVGAATWNYLQTLTSVNGNLATASGTSGIVIHNYGYGASGEYITAAGAVLTTNNPGSVQGFATNTAFAAADQPGVGRITNQISLGLQPISGAIIGNATYGYTYTGLTWTLPANNPAHLGQTTQGDNGGAIQSFTGAIVGINTVQQSSAVMGGADFVYGVNFGGQNFDGGGIGFNQADLNFLNSQYGMIAAPEPAPVFALGILAAAALRRSRRSRRS